MKNRGFSLIELIVVVAIMAVALTVGGYALSAISLANAKNCATEIKSSLEKTRTQACSTDKGTSMAVLSLYRDADGKVCISKNYEGTEKEIGSKTVSVKYRVKGNATYLDLGTTPLKFGFDRSSGGFKAVEGSSIVEGIQISSGGRTYTLTCYELTGKIKME